MKILILISAMLGFLAVGQLQIISDKSFITITGTSSLHDWEMKVNEFSATGIVEEAQVKDLVVTVKSKSMESGKAIMDEKAYDAVSADDYPSITFSAKTLKISEDQIFGKGTLKIAEVSNEINFNAKIISKQNNEMHLEGSIPLKMSDYKITPPTAMFGTLKTGDEVEIVYIIFLTI